MVGGAADYAYPYVHVYIIVGKAQATPNMPIALARNIWGEIPGPLAARLLSMSSPASPETIALRLGLDVKELGRSCDEALLPSLANFVHPWREVFAHLLAPLDLDDIDSENAGRSEQTKRLASLHKWKVKCGGKATYGVLITALLNNRDVRNAENVCQQLLQHLEGSYSNYY